MALLQVVDVTIDGATELLADADVDGDDFPNDGKTILRVRNGSLVEITITVLSRKQCDQGAFHNEEMAVPAGQTRTMGPFPTGRFNDGNGRGRVEYTEVADVEVGAESI